MLCDKQCQPLAYIDLIIRNAVNISIKYTLNKEWQAYYMCITGCMLAEGNPALPQELEGQARVLGEGQD